MKYRLCALALLCALVLTLTGCGAKTVASGDCGENVTWTLDNRGKLTISAAISGSKMDDYSLLKLPPWVAHRESITSVVIDGNVAYVGEGAFYQNFAALEKVAISEGVTGIGKAAFFGCTALKDVSLPNSLTTFGNVVFGECSSLKNVTLPENMTTLSEGTFFACASLENVKLPDGMTTIGNSAFMDCTALKSIVLPQNTSGIEDFAFSGCSALESVVIPANVITLAASALYDCTALKDVYFGGTREQWKAFDVDFMGALSKADIHIQ